MCEINKNKQTVQYNTLQYNTMQYSYLWAEKDKCSYEDPCSIQRGQGKNILASTSKIL